VTMDVLEKLTILTDAAKYDAACTSSGGSRGPKKGYLGNTSSSVAGCCHSFSADGRCVTLLKVLLTNNCVYDCKYCVNRRSNDARRAAFTPEELADLTIQFYRRNYIEGLFLSSGVFRSPDYTTELMIRALRLLRETYRFNGYIHAKAIPGTSPDLVEQLGFLADRLSVNIELPSEMGLKTLAPDKTKGAILAPMKQIQTRNQQSKEELVKYRHAPKFAPAGQSTQLIVGATADSDFHILRLTQGLYDRYRLKRVFYSAYVPVVEHALLPSRDVKPPLLREHRLYQADWLLRFYGFRAEELLDEEHQDFNPQVDPKCSWALSHLDFFPVEVNTADYETLLRIPGVGVTSARRILSARRAGRLQIDHLRRLGVVMKRAQYFLTADHKMADGLRFTPDSLLRSLVAAERPLLPQPEPEQLSLFDSAGTA
jgi:putative DNA modification/repair radical SAM protein